MLSLSIHPTGKLALSTGADSTLRLWDLVTGRGAFRIRFDHGTAPPRASRKEYHSVVPANWALSLALLRTGDKSSGDCAVVADRRSVRDRHGPRGGVLRHRRTPR